MNVIESLEAMKSGFSVVAFCKFSTMSTELFKVVAPNRIELYLPDETDHPVDVMSFEKFTELYSHVEFLSYNC